MVDENKNENQTSLIIQIPVPPIIKTNYQKISEENYKYIKKEITDIAIKRMNEIVPNFKEKISVIELATPRTFEKWVGTTEGASTGFTWNKSKSFLKATSFDKMFLETDLKNLYQCGAFSSATGGVFFSGLSGMLVAEQITKLHKKKKK